MFISFKKNKIMLIIDSHTHIFKSLKGKISKGNTLSSNYGKITIASKKTENFLPPLCQKTTFTPEMLLEYMRLLNIFSPASSVVNVYSVGMASPVSIKDSESSVAG